MSTNTFTQRFPDWGSWLEYVSKPAEQTYMTSSNKTDSSFSGTSSYDEALKLAASGWHDAEADARKITNALVTKIGGMVERDVEYYDVEGLSIDMDRYIEGDPDNWLNYDKTFIVQPGPIIRLVFNIAASAGVDKSVMIAKGAAVAGLIECIELSGRQVELWTTDYAEPSYGSGVPVEVRILVKPAGQPLDMGRVMYAIGHPSHHRRLWFRWLERQKQEINYAYRLGYGMPVDLPKEGFDRGDLYIASSYLDQPQWRNEKSAIEWVIKTLRQLNIQVNDNTGVGQ